MISLRCKIKILGIKDIMILEELHLELVSLSLYNTRLVEEILNNNFNKICTPIDKIEY